MWVFIAVAALLPPHFSDPFIAIADHYELDRQGVTEAYNQALRFPPFDIVTSDPDALPAHYNAPTLRYAVNDVRYELQVRKEVSGYPNPGQLRRVLPCMPREKLIEASRFGFRVSHELDRLASLVTDEWERGNILFVARECRRTSDAYDALVAAKFCPLVRHRRLGAKQLLDIIGPEAFAAGYMPPPVPIYALPEVRQGDTSRPIPAPERAPDVDDCPD